jgi:Flp pilus assembly protein TadG
MRVIGLRRLKDERGSYMVEFAIVAFLFSIVLFGIFELGRMVLVYTTVANSARVGARYAIVHGGFRTGSGSTGPSGPGSTTEIETVVKNFAGAGLLDTSRLTINVTYPDGDNAAGHAVNVSVTYPYDPFIRYFNSPLSVTLGSTSRGVITF